MCRTGSKASLGKPTQVFSTIEELQSCSPLLACREAPAADPAKANPAKANLCKASLDKSTQVLRKSMQSKSEQVQAKQI